MMRRAGLHALLMLVLASLAGTAPTLAQPPGVAATRVLDDFEDVRPWTAGASDGVQRLGPSRRSGPVGRALRLDFDLAGTAGYALARRALPLDLPANYEIVFSIRGDAPANHFQVKLVDASGENVWWFNRPDFEFPREWQTSPDQEAPHRFRVGTHQGPHAAERGGHRVRASRPVVAVGGGGWR